MGGANGAPDEEEGQTGERKQPVEDGHALGGQADVGKETKAELKSNAVERSAGLVHVGEETGSHLTGSHGLDGAGRSEGARVGDTDNRDGDDGVEDGGQDLDAGILDGQDEGRSLGVGTVGVEKAVVVGGQDETEDEQVDDVEEEDTEENLLGGTGDGLAGVLRLGSSQTDQLSATESERGNDEDGTETVEAVVESTGVGPVLGANVALVADTTAVDDDSKNDEANAGADLDHGEDELDFTVTLDAKDLDDGKSDQEDRDPDTHADRFVPEFDGNTSGNEFEGQDGKPGNSVIPAHSKAPGRIEEADDIGIEGTVDGVEDRQFGQGLHGEQQHDTDDHVTDNLERSWLVEAKISLGEAGEHTKAAGPPLLRAPPEPMNRPAPMAPPMAIICMWRPLRSFFRASDLTMPTSSSWTSWVEALKAPGPEPFASFLS